MSPDEELVDECPAGGVHHWIRSDERCDEYPGREYADVTLCSECGARP